ncbi:MAG: molybdenum cofactor biosynthesis protein B [Planctomycetota bacterium]|nr:MAG: molybdenum cofactor biosynthesis protein B [Planctomycetota bacterium]
MQHEHGQHHDPDHAHERPHGRTHAHAHGADGAGFVALGAAVLVVSDTRDLDTDASGKYLEQQLAAAGHRCVERRVVKDEIEAVRAAVAAWCQRDEVRVILVTGGTGVTPRDVTPEALEPLFEKALPGFGELFRQLSFQEIGSSAIQSRATAGILRGRLVFALPGSRGACRLALEQIILPQLDARTLPCSFPTLLNWPPV